jgi:hypothetical protein
MVLVFVAVVFVLLPAALVAGFLFGVATGYKARQRQREKITALTQRLAKHEHRPRSPINVTYAPGAPLAELVNKHIQFWRDYSALPETDDELLAGLDEDSATKIQ